ncbi:MAG: IS6 family transposase [Pyrinomonadaceae bacterium]
MPKSPFKWRHFEPAIILLCVRWYCRYQLSYRDLEEMMSERGLSVDHTTVWRWVQRYAPEINKRIRPHLKMSGAPFRVDETYIKVGKTCKYLYRAVDKEGQTIEFMLSAKRDVSAAERTLEGVEAMNMIRKGQVKRLAGSDAMGQAKFVAALFQIAA